MVESDKKELSVGEPLPYDLILTRGRISFRKGTPVTREILRILEQGNIVQLKIEAPLRDSTDIKHHNILETPTSPKHRLKCAYLFKIARTALGAVSSREEDPLSSFSNQLNSIWTNQSTSLDSDLMMYSTETWVRSLQVLPYALASVGWLQSGSDFLPEHMINVARFTSTIGLEMGYGSENLIEMTLAGLLHDIGAMFIDRNILLRTNKLEPGELKRIREHPRQSVEWLKRSGLHAETILRLVLRHHERFDGSGYPYNITGKVLGDDDSFLALLDVYAALISNRPHRTAYTRRNAMKIIQSVKGKSFPDELVQRFSKLMGLYPPGSLVQLKGGGIALILHSPIEGRWPALMLDMENDSQQAGIIDLNHLSGDYIIKEFA